METNQIIDEIIDKLKNACDSSRWEPNYGHQNLIASVAEDLSNGFSCFATLEATRNIFVEGKEPYQTEMIKITSVDVSLEIFDQNEHRLFFPFKGFRLISKIESNLKKHLEP